MKLVFITGMPLSGKSTISGLLKGFHDFKHISTGDIARDVQRVFKYNSDGENLDKFAESIIRYTVYKFIDDNKHKDVVIDGFPRSVQQLDFIKKIVKKKYDVVILNVTAETSYKRASFRNRNDDINTIVDRRRSAFPLRELLNNLAMNGINHKVFNMDEQIGIEQVKQYIVAK